MKKSTISLFFGLACLVAGLAVTGCKKPEDTIAKINVRNATNGIVSGAQVILEATATDPSQQGNVAVGDTTTSNAAGEAIFNLNKYYDQGQAGVIVFDVKCMKGSLSGDGIIKIEEEQTTTQTVIIE
ncbi:MAG: hypothetical protein ACI9XP_000498 [Lentimonas sp.]|jgi:hypothetical protein